MKKTQIIFIVISVLSLSFFTACNKYGSPEEVLGSAYQALEQGKEKSFSRTLTKDLRNSRPVNELMGALKEKLAPYTDLQIKNQQLINVQRSRMPICSHNNPNFYQFKTVDTHHDYSNIVVGVTQSGNQESVLKTQISCDFQFFRKTNRTHQFCYDAAGMLCKISAIEFYSWKI